MANYYKRLRADLAAAASSGVITPGQADKAYEQAYARRLTAGWKAAHLIAVFAGLFIAIGLLLIIAHNWDKLGTPVKIGGFLLLFAAAGLTAIQFEEKTAVAVPAEVLWFFMPAIGIGLYAQLFQLSGDPVKPYLVWAALVLPLALLARRTLTAFLLTILLFLTLFYGTLGHGSLLSLSSGGLFSRSAPVPPPWWHWLLALAVLAAAAGTALYRRCHSVMRVLGASLAWVLLLLVYETPLRLQSPALLLLAVSAAAALWLAWTPDGDRLESRLPHLAWLSTVYGMTFFWHFRPGMHYGSDSPGGAALAWALFIGAVLSAAFRPLAYSSGPRWRTALRAALIAPMLAAFMLFDATVTSAKAIALLANFIVIAAGAGLIWNGAQENVEKRINTGVLFIALIVLTRFFDLFGSMLKSGLGFIGTGLLFAVLAWFINKGRRAIIQAAGGEK